MRARTIAATLALFLLAVAASFAQNPNIGTWKLNAAKSKIPAGVGQNNTVVYTAAAGDMMTVTTDGVDGSGKPAHTEWTGKFDGKPYPVTGSSAVDARAVTAKGDHVLEIDNMKGGKSVSKGKVELAKDGKSRTLETEGTSADGKKYKAKYVYDKQ
jgi:beta-xylosidase